jgi:2-polyprenyl-6-methoxyphenol hydroxylase-like FAD-dependent oxidoreductase
MATLRSLIARNLLDADFPYCLNTMVRFVTSSAAGHRCGHTAWAPHRDLALMRWGDLYRTLRRRVPDASYHHGCAVTDARMIDQHSVELRFDDSSTQRFDLVIFADGYQSLGRRLLFPDLDVHYCGYVAWRGLLDERQLTDSAPVESASARVIFRDMPGHLIPNLVPGPRGSVAQGERTVNWVAYLAMPPDELPRFLTDRFGHQHTHSLPPGGMRPEEEHRLRTLVAAQVPPYYAAIVTASRDTFAQPIYRVEPPAYYRDRLCLIGDAGAVVPPVTGSGVFRGMTNAIELVTALHADEDLNRALGAWDEAQAVMGQRLTTWGKQMEQALIWATPDLARLDAAAVEDWWNRTVPPPLT